MKNIMRVCGLVIKKQESQTLQGYNASLVIQVICLFFCLFVFCCFFFFLIMGGGGYSDGSLNPQILSVII